MLLVDVVLLFELLDTSTAVDELLLACKERMALRADIEPHLRLCGSDHECVPACASYFTFHVVWMDSFPHAVYLLSDSD